MELLSEGGPQSPLKGGWGLRIIVHNTNGCHTTCFEDFQGTMLGVSYDGFVVYSRTGDRFKNREKALKTAIMIKEVPGKEFDLRMSKHLRHYEWEIKFLDDERGPCIATVAVKEKEILVSKRINQ